MNDCANADVRDLLPDLMHGRLDSSAHAMVESHLRGCADCRKELALLRDLQASLRATHALDIAAIGAAIPSYRAPARRAWVGWRAAAAITLVAAGGSSLLVLQRNITLRQDSVVVAATPSSPVPAQPPVAVSTPAAVAPRMADTQSGSVERAPRTAAVMASPVTPALPAGGRELAMGSGSLTDLSDRELTSLLKGIESLDALPTTEVESTSLSPIAPRRGAP